MMSYLPNFADMVSIETLVNWCGDYLTEDQQLVVVKGEASNQLTVTSGASQGSLLGPIFFIVYINDLRGGGGLISKDSSISLYANDSKLYRVSGRSRGETRGVWGPPNILSEKENSRTKKKS